MRCLKAVFVRVVTVVGRSWPPYHGLFDRQQRRKKRVRPMAKTFFRSVAFRRDLLTILLMTAMWVGMGLKGGHAAQSIIALVNDEPISVFDLNQRIKLMTANSPQAQKLFQKKLRSPRTQERWQALLFAEQPMTPQEVERLKRRLINEVRNEVRRELGRQARRRALEELINERLQVQAARNNNIVVTEAELDERIDMIARSNKNPRTGKPMTRKTFYAMLRQMGIDVREYKKRMSAQLAWGQLIRRKFRAHIMIRDKDVDAALAKAPAKQKGGQKQALLHLQKISLRFPVKAGEAQRVARLKEAQKLRSQLRGCRGSDRLVKRLKNASLRTVGRKTPQDFPQPIRTFLDQAQPGETTPPSISSTAVEMFLVCKRSQTYAADPKKRMAVMAKLQQKEFARLAKSYLHDLRQDAYIECRDGPYAKLCRSIAGR